MKNPSSTLRDIKWLAAFLAVSESAIERGLKMKPDGWPRPTIIRGRIHFTEADIVEFLTRRRFAKGAASTVPMIVPERLVERAVIAKKMDRSLSWFEKGQDRYPEALPPAYRVGRLWRYSEPEVDAWLEAHKVVAA